MLNSNLKIISLYRLLCRLRPLLIYIYQKLRIWKYKIFSDKNYSIGIAKLNQPVLISGQGSVKLRGCNLGVYPSPYFFNGYIHIEAREATAVIEIGDGVWINNNAVIIAERSSIYIGDNTLIGSEFTVYDSDFHDLHPKRRMSSSHACKSVSIGSNVFIGSRVTILKGVSIGNNAVIAAGSIVNIDVSENMIVGGVPIRVLGKV